ncbi:MAG: hypothetical protein KC468_27630, partial [Myxococcales bacterium]|nr:hypothetical protein [Myxococcales bacterium]
AARQRGAALPAVVHRARHRRSGMMIALTDNYVRVAIASDDDRMLGATARVRIERVDSDGGAVGSFVRA